MVKKVIKRIPFVHDSIFIYTILPNTQENTNLKVNAYWCENLTQPDTNEQDNFGTYR